MFSFRKIIPDRAKHTVTRECSLSFNHIYHRICLVEDRQHDEQPYILIQNFVPKHSVSEEVQKKVKSNNYNYLFQVPDDFTYTASTTTCALA